MKTHNENYKNLRPYFPIKEAKMDLSETKTFPEKWISKQNFLSSPIECVAFERTELLKTEIGVDKMV